MQAVAALLYNRGKFLRRSRVGAAKDRGSKVKVPKLDLHTRIKGRRGHTHTKGNFRVSSFGQIDLLVKFIDEAFI